MKTYCSEEDFTLTFSSFSTKSSHGRLRFDTRLRPITFSGILKTPATSARLFDLFSAQPSSFSKPVDLMRISLVRYFVFFNEWFHSKHLVRREFRLSRGGITPSLRNIDWFHIAPRPHIAAAAPVSALIFSKSEYSKTSPFAITGQDTDSTTCFILSQCAASLGRCPT